MSHESPGRTIPLTKGFVAIVDEEDYERVSKLRWHFNSGYARRNRKRDDGSFTCQFMARFIMGEPAEMLVEHRSTNTLDNRKSNLRLATPSQNKCNQGPDCRNTSGFKGVYWHRGIKRWVATIKFQGQRKALGCFDSAEEASHRYKTAALSIHGEFARFDRVMPPIRNLTGGTPLKAEL